ncbi:hypothetical protein Ahy_A10g047676 [Arachis hypogaea]|uniref:CCHC-type domain-containing protein n=1 Tax=Arachis hypogaea TaxID=3818 RepID=A0A445B344_ARAHY|nr:hypothetical protein Ahy_A10g047676 [Arachis hypogaea]
MDDRVILRVYYFGQILLQTSEGVRFSCEKPLDIVIPFTISFEELKGVICEKIGFQISKKISCMVYRYPIPVFGGFVQYQTKYVTDEASMQEMFSMYFETRGQISVIELHVEFEQSEADRNIEGEEYDSDSEEEFESNYEAVAPDGEEDQGDGVVAPNVGDVANALANEDPFEEPSFMRVLDLEAMHAPEFSEYMSADGEFAIGVEFSSREAVMMAVKDYTIRRGVDYRVYESEPLTFYAKCTQYGSGCDWLIRVSMISRKYCWVIRSNLRQHVVTRDGVGLISDRHESINAAVARSNGAWSPPRAFHMFCIKHIESNFLRKFKAPYLQKLVINIGYSRTVREYEVRYQRLRERGEAYTNWLNRIPRERYALAFDGGYRWGHMTTNLVECINSVLKGARNLPITALVKATFYRLNELFTRKRAEAESRITAGHVFSEVVTSKLNANQLASSNIQVNCFDRMNEVFEVREMPGGTEYAVDLRRQRCDCGEFQVDGFPVDMFLHRLDWRVYVHEVYKMDRVRRVYRARFRPLGNPTTWPVYSGPRFVPNPNLRRVTKGRLRMTRLLNEMDTRILRAPRRCRQCGAEGHSRSRCRRSAGVGPSNPGQ